MKVFATTAIEETMKGVGTYVPLFTRLAEQDRFGVHGLIDDPHMADIILFLDGHQHYQDLDLNAIRRHPLAEKYREKTFVYSEQDQPWCAMQGLYVSMPAGPFNWARQRPCAYLSLMNSLVATADSGVRPDLLFSYMGRTGHPVRDAVKRLRHPRAMMEDTTGVSFFGKTTEAVEKQKLRYAEVIRRSKFVLCPRGSGTSSFRLFETLAAGRVPVILSDEWVPPMGPAWVAASLRIGEADVEKIPSILERNERRFPEMAAAARNLWEEWFASDVLFHRMVESCCELKEQRGASGSVWHEKLNSRYLHLWARSMKSRVKSRLRA